jgi:hypothetical protein
VIRAIAQAVVIALAFLILVAEVQRADEAPAVEISQ